MKRLFLLAVALVGAISIDSCGGNKAATETSTTPAPETTATAATDTAARHTPPPTLLSQSKYDSGPRAGASAANAAMAEQGKALFTSTGCVACHAYGRVLLCPDLKGVSMQRTATWMENQILHPEVMVKEDPISWELSTHFKLPMTNQGLTPGQAKAVIEYLKQMDKQSGATAAATH